MSLVYDPRRYLVGSGAQKQLEVAIAKLVRRRRRARLGFALALLVLLFVYFGKWFMRYDPAFYATDDRIMFTIAFVGASLCIFTSIGYIFVAQDDLKYIRSNPAAYACSKRWQGAQFIANVTPNKLTCKLPQSPPGAAHQTPTEACKSALNRLLELHTQCVKPLPNLADAYLSAFFELQKTFGWLDYLWGQWNQKGRPEHDSQVFPEEGLANQIIESSQSLLEIAKAIQQTADQFESAVASSASSTSPTTTQGV